MKDTSLLLCEGCKKEISNGAESCPYCGKLVHSPGLITRFFFAICHPMFALVVGLLLLIVGLILIF